ncbi:MAG: acylneuraminate cytidylyltransferase family protein [Nitrospirae bacterium]|nr:acylneuraminate cytidylyltransferase family protein [Nitrospirota bacterium]
MKKNIVAIIPARGGSKGLPGKHLKPLLGKPLIAYTIDAAKQCALIDRVIVTTDDERIAEVAKKYGAEVPFIRDAELAGDYVPIEPVLKHAVEWLENNENYKTDIVVYLQSTDVFRKKRMIEEVITRLLERDDLDSAFVAYTTHKNFWRKTDGKYVRLAPDINYGPRQKKEPLYREDTGLACATRASVVKEGKRLGANVDIIPNYDDASSVDIHEEFDLWLAEKILSEGRRTIND